MRREQKQIEVDAIKERFLKAEIAILSDYKGLKVVEFNELRSKLREKESEIKVVKNRLAKIALKGTEFEPLMDYFTGTTALTITRTDPIASAKVLVEFAKDHEAVKFKAGFMQGRLIAKNDIEILAKLPGRNELLARLLGSMQAPIRNLVSVMAQIPRQFVQVLAALRDRKEKEG